MGDDYQSERQQNSPSNTDISDDSVDIKFSSIVIPTNKRKSLSTQKSETDIPLKKRIRYEAVYAASTDIDASARCAEPAMPLSAYRPWQPAQPAHGLPDEAEILARHPAVTTLHCAAPAADSHLRAQLLDDNQPLALVTRKPQDDTKPNAATKAPKKRCPPKNHKTAVAVAVAATTAQGEPASNGAKLAPPLPPPAAPLDDSASKKLTKSAIQRNYKNMTRERRIEANARERTRVHTISAAFDTLRSAVPSYSSTQKLSKLSVLRVACAYILTLSRMAGDDYSADQSEPSMASCIDEITKTIQTEGKSRKRKDD